MPKAVDKDKQFIQIIINKKVDIEDVMMSDTYDEYIENVDLYVDSGVFNTANELSKEEFKLIKEVIKKYGK